MSIGIAQAMDAARLARVARARRRASPRRTAWGIGIAVLLIFVVTGGGRIVGSDEVTMFELSRALLHGRIAVSEGATLRGPDGRFYSKNAAGQAIAALPLTAIAEGVTRAAGVPGPRAVLAMRFGVSFFDAVIAAILLGVFYTTVRALGVRPWPSAAATLMLGFTTPLWVYAKSFMAEPLEALGLMLALGGAARAGAGDPRGARRAGLGAFLAISAKLSMLPLALVCLLPLTRRPRAWGWAIFGVVAALAGHAIYDLARFGTPFETGYGAQASLAAYTTPLLVGLYGLLLSSGKGVLWFAPALWLAFAGWRAVWARPERADPEIPPPAGFADAARRAAWGALAAWLVALLLYARFQHWAGDGSFGPRYLVPLLPLGFVLVGYALQGAGPMRRSVAAALAAIGLLVQIGGVAIYFGAQMREAGDYPYTLPIEHPRFMSDSHFNPRFTPIAGHWRMLIRNAGEHLRGERPTFDPSHAGESRLEIGAEDQARLLHALDFWWLYLVYAGLPARAVWLVAAVLAFAAAAALGRALALTATEARAEEPLGP